MKMIKWWKKVFWHLIDISIINSWIIFRLNHPNSKIKSQREFRLELVKQLVQPLLNLKASPECPSVLQLHKGQRANISLTKLLRKEGAVLKCVCSKRRSSRGKRVDKKTNYCPKCEVYLCLGECFKWFHTKSQY